MQSSEQTVLELLVICPYIMNGLPAANQKPGFHVITIYFQGELIVYSVIDGGGPG